MGDIITTSISTIQTFTSSIVTNNLQVGTVSSLSYIAFPGLQQGYAQSIVTEQATASGIQELLLFRGSTTTDRIRMQTTGNIVFEPGVSARVFPATGSNATPAMIINTSSNVGIGVASPGVALDVAGAGRFTSNIIQTATGAYISNAGILSNTGAAAYFQNTSNSGTLAVGGIATYVSNIVQTATGAYISNAGILSNTGAAAYFAATSNTGTLGVAGIATLAAATVTAFSNSGNLSNAGFISNNGILSNTTAAAYFQNTSNTGTLGVGGIATLAAATVTAFSNSGNLSNAGFISNNGILSNTTAAAYFQNTSNTGTLGVAGTTYLASTGIGTITPLFPLDVYGISRSAIPISSISNSNATFGNNSYGIYYYITNSGFSNIIFTSVTPTPAAGWYILLRNNTGSYLSITPTGASAGLLASAFTIPPANSVTVAYDSTASTWVSF